MLCGMWDLPGPGIEPMSPTLAYGFYITEPPGSPESLYLLICLPYFSAPPTLSPLATACSFSESMTLFCYLHSAFFFKIPRISKITRYLSFSVWNLITLLPLGQANCEKAGLCPESKAETPPSNLHTLTFFLMAH